MPGTATVDNTPGSKSIVLLRLAIVSGLVVTVLGGGAVWRAVDRLDEAWARYVVVQGEMQDLRAILGARLDEAGGQTGLDLGTPTTDEALQDQFDELFEWAEVEATDIEDVVDARESDVLDSAGSDGVADEQLITGLDSALRDLDREVVRPVSNAAHDERDTARATVVVVFVLSAALWGAVALFARRATRRNPTSAPRLRAGAVS